jgi:hypothetical protein
MSCFTYISSINSKGGFSMNTEQKVAWFLIILCCVSSFGFLALIPFLGPTVSLSVFSILGLYGFSPWIFRAKKRTVKISVDERDRLIIRKATLAGAISSYSVFVIGCMLPWFIYMYQGKKVINIMILPFIMLCGVIVLLLVRSIVLLVLYNREVDYARA